MPDEIAELPSVFVSDSGDPADPSYDPAGPTSPADPTAARRPAATRPPASRPDPSAYGPEDQPGDLAGLFPPREGNQADLTSHSVIDLTRHERLVAASTEHSGQQFERPVPPGFPVELPQPSARREQLLFTAVSWLIVLFTTLLGALGGLTYSSLQTASYSATSSVLVSSVNNSTSAQDSAAFAKAFAQVANATPAIIQPGLLNAGISMPADEASKHLEVSVPDGASLITVRATANSGADAAALANAAADGMVTYSTERQADTGQRVSQFTVATAPATASKPQRALSVVIGALIGLAVGGAVVLVIRRSRRPQAAAEA